jgi:hypothetical protein
MIWRIGELYGYWKAYKAASRNSAGQPGPKPGATIPAGTIGPPTSTVYTATSGAFDPGTTVETGIRAGEITGYRAWWLSQGTLHSIFMTGFKWEPGVPAEGDVSGGVGVHAHKTLGQLLEYVIAIKQWYDNRPEGYYDLTLVDPRLVTGTVAMWGDVVEHEKGYRAEFAKVTALAVSNPQLLEKYGVGCGYRSLDIQ